MKQEMNDAKVVKHLKERGIYDEMLKKIQTQPDKNFSAINGMDLYFYFTKKGDSGWVWFHAETVDDFKILPLIIADWARKNGPVIDGGQIVTPRGELK